MYIDGVFSHDTSKAINYTMEWSASKEQYTCRNVTLYDSGYICQANVEVAGEIETVMSSEITISTHCMCKYLR